MGKVKIPRNKDKKRKVGRRADLSNSTDRGADVESLISSAVLLLQTGQPDAALPLAQQAANKVSSKKLLALAILGEINVELGDAPSALVAFSKCVDMDPDGTLPESEGGGPEKFFWLAQLSETGGRESIAYYEKGIAALEKLVTDNQGDSDPGAKEAQEERRKKLATALCGMCEVWMTDLSFEDDAEAQCEDLITRAMAVSSAPYVPTLQTLASIRLSQSRIDEAQAALKRSLALWQNLDPEDPEVPEFASRISLARLLMEAGMEEQALHVVERLVGEDDQSVEAWYLGGWCLWLMLPDPENSSVTQHEEDTKRLQLSSREWLRNCLKLYELLDYEDERLRDHAKELVTGLDKVLGDAEIEDEESEGAEWEDENDSEAEEDHEMHDS